MPGSGDIYTLQEGKLIPILMEGIKQERTEIARQDAKIAKQQGQSDQLLAALAGSKMGGYSVRFSANRMKSVEKQ